MAKPGSISTKDWPASKVELWSIEKIIPYSGNPRTHPQAQIDLIAKSMVDDGVTAPILVDEKGVIIYGHGRRLAALQNGFKKYPVAVAKGWSEKQKTAARIKDNSYGLMSGWDDGLMQAALAQLKFEEYPLELLGFPERELLAFGISSGTVSDQDPEAVPEVPKKPVVRKGDLWVLGEHRLLCGDSTNADDVAKAMGGATPHLLVSDPPYGVDYDPNWRNEEAAKGHLAYAASRVGVVKNDDRNDWREAWALFTGDVAYCWHAGRHASSVQASLEATGLMIRSQIIWAKSNYPISRGHYHWRHEPCWYAVREGKTGHWQGARDQTTLWEINLDKNVEGGHSTQKPIDCMKRPIENNSRKGEEVYDPFLGSGTTLIACEMTGRKCIGIEIDPGYCQVVIERWQTFTSKLATLDGKSLEQVAKARRSGREKGKTDEAGDLGEPSTSGNRPRDTKKRTVRKGGDAGQPAEKRSANGKPPAVPAGA